MARLIRPLRQWPQLKSHCHCCATLNHLPSPPLAVSTKITLFALSSSTLPSSRRCFRHWTPRPKPPNALMPVDLIEQNDSDTDDADDKKSRSQMKRDARRAVRWGMELAAFSTTQIKRILGVAGLGDEVFEALMVAKRLGGDVREGKRRQFNYIGKLLRDVEPELMDALIRSTKEGDLRTLQALANLAQSNAIDEVEDEVETAVVDEAQTPEEFITIARRWFDGLVSKNEIVTKEVYSLQIVDFDRQDLRKLVRKVHSVQEQSSAASEESSEESNEESKEKINLALKSAENSLNKFLRTLAKQMLKEQHLVQSDS